MRVPLHWLREYCDPDLDTAAVEERLTMTGTKVEAIHRVGVAELDHFVVGRVLEAERHPQADRLSVCRVDVGDGRTRTIVCGAPNVAAGQTVAVAQPGAVVANGTKLGVARLRGIESEGMILAEDELGIGSDHAGILVLGDGLAPGTPLSELLALATDVLELEITPNRPDCLSVYGVARELHAATRAALAPPPWADDPGSAGAAAGAEVVVECPDLCPRFTARVFEDVKLGPSPPWLKARLTAAGQRPISNVVDITNYVMLLTGQPLHAFDLDRVVGGRLVVRRAREGEQVQTLDGQNPTLDREMVVIDHAQGPTSIAGVMGGARSEVQDGTTRVLMEAATWVGPNIHRTSWTLGLRSEASGRFEKGLPPEAAMQAQAVAARLMSDLCGARLQPGTIDVREPLPTAEPVLLRERRVGEILGVQIPRERQAEILAALGFHTAAADDGLEVTVPAWRRDDVTREADLIEEVSRIDGLERLPATLPKRRGAHGMLSPAQRLCRRAVDALVGRGLYEVVGWTFTSPALLDRLRLPAGDPRRASVTVDNPLSSDQSLLRPTLIGSLLDIAHHNVARGSTDLALLEVGTAFTAEPGAPLPRERTMLSALISGSQPQGGWDGEAPLLFAAKALVEALADVVRCDLRFVPAREPFLHPGRCAAVRAGEATIGWLGELHPLVTREWSLPDSAAFEIDLHALVAAADAVPHYRDLTSYPPNRQDFAVALAEDVPAARVIDLVHEVGGPLVTAAGVFDVYRGPQVGAGQRSLAISVTFQAPDRTLSDEDVQPLRDKIVEALQTQLGGELRA